MVAHQQPGFGTPLRAPHDKDDWGDLWRVGPGTPMGHIMRQYWQPVVESRRLTAGKAMPIQLLGERFTLYRGEDDTPRMLAERCPHRGTVLHVGWVEGPDLRCMYHGWKFDGSGQCVEMPAETVSFAQKVRINGYPAADYAGLVFVYLGGGEPPELPRKAEIDNATVVWSKMDVWPCNWLQQKENSFDPLHVSFTHRVGPLGEAVSGGMPQIDCVEHEWGFAVKAIRPNGNERIVETLFPHGTHVNVPQPNDYSQPWIELFTWSVPLDDGHTAFVKTYASQVTGDAAAQLRAWFDAQSFSVPAHHREIFDEPRDLPADNSMHQTEAQDYLTQVGQGQVFDRTQEWLGSSDVAVIQFRRALRREVRIVEDGGTHTRRGNRYGPAQLPLPPSIGNRS